MLNKREIGLAQELARELALLNQTSEDEEFERATNMLAFVHDVIEKAYNIIKDFISSVEEFIGRMKGDNHRYNWHVPVKINPPPMPDIPMPRMMNIRSDL